MREERLVPLAKEYGPRAVWFAGIEALGFPPTIQPSFQEVLRISEFLVSQKGTRQ